MAKACFVDEEDIPDKELCKALTEGVTLRNKGVQYDSQRTLNKRSLVLDEESFEKTFLVCAVCRDSFTNPLKPPKLLPCHHSFCLPCIKSLFQTEVEYRQSLTPSLRGMPTAVSLHCPTCRGNFITTEENVRTLPTDHRVVQLLDFVQHTERYTVSFCSKHKLQALNFFCEPCIQPVCRDCTVLDHKEQDGHLVMDLNEALEKYTPVLDTAIKEMDTEAGVLGKKQETLDTATKKLEGVRTDLLKNIHDTFGRLKQQLAEREREMESIAENEVNKEKKKLDEKAEKLSSRRKALLDHSSTLKQAKEESSIEEMFSIHQQYREYRAQPPIKIREVDDGIMTTFSFNARDESILSSRINNFGDICAKVESTFHSTSGYGYPTSRSTYK
ncbi:tripartite motif-containing protein 2-like [Haliotis cracherodii]|uniref:tripartite motif-containing protein 2-like n=1 Tax=Haliotis cracherodii TaxID=6455 RepID=UPI0039E875DD